MSVHPVERLFVTTDIVCDDCNYFDTLTQYVTIDILCHDWHPMSWLSSSVTIDIECHDWHRKSRLTSDWHRNYALLLQHYCQILQYYLFFHSYCCILRRITTYCCYYLQLFLKYCALLLSKNACHINYFHIFPLQWIHQHTNYYIITKFILQISRAVAIITTGRIASIRASFLISSLHYYFVQISITCPLLPISPTFCCSNGSITSPLLRIDFH
jgi:hypothetical protein